MSKQPKHRLKRDFVIPKGTPLYQRDCSEFDVNLLGSSDFILCRIHFGPSGDREKYVEPVPREYTAVAPVKAIRYTGVNGKSVAGFLGSNTWRAFNGCLEVRLPNGNDLIVSSDMIVTVSPNGPAILTPHAFERLFGVPAAEVPTE